MEEKNTVQSPTLPNRVKYLYFQIADLSTGYEGVDLFANKLKGFQLVRPSGVDIAPNAEQLVAYDWFLEDIKTNPQTVKEIRFEGVCESDTITFTREVFGSVFCKRLPVALLGKVDSFNNSIITLSFDEGLLLDGKTNINIRSFKRNITVTLEVTVDYTLKDADKSFLNFINNQYATFYDYLTIKNPTLDHQPFKLFFTETGIECTNPKLEGSTNGYGYKIGDNVRLWKGYCKSLAMLTEIIKAIKWQGEYKSDTPSENYHTAQYLIPRTEVYQTSPTLVHGIDKEGRKIVSFKEPVYEHWLRAEQSISFTIFKNVEQKDLQHLWLTSCYNPPKNL